MKPVREASCLLAHFRYGGNADEILKAAGTGSLKRIAVRCQGCSARRAAGEKGVIVQDTYSRV